MDSKNERHAVVHGDAFSELESLPNDSAHAAIVDYPWELNIKTSGGDVEFRNAPRGASQGCRDRDGDEVMFPTEDETRFGELFEELSRVIVDGAYVICFADDRVQEVIREAMRESPITFRRNWAWSPKQIGMGYYGRVNHYPIPVGTNGETERYVQGRGTLYDLDAPRQEAAHPTAKPVELYRELLKPPVLKAGETLLEPFCGSAPGAAVAHERGLSYWGCDVDVDAVRMAKERFNQTRLGQGRLA